MLDAVAPRRSSRSLDAGALALLLVAACDDQDRGTRDGQPPDAAPVDAWIDATADDTWDATVDLDARVAHPSCVQNGVGGASAYGDLSNVELGIPVDLVVVSNPVRDEDRFRMEADPTCDWPHEPDLTVSFWPDIPEGVAVPPIGTHVRATAWVVSWGVNEGVYVRIVDQDGGLVFEGGDPLAVSNEGSPLFEVVWGDAALCDVCPDDGSDECCSVKQPLDVYLHLPGERILLEQGPGEPVVVDETAAIVRLDGAADNVSSSPCETDSTPHSVGVWVMRAAELGYPDESDPIEVCVGDCPLCE